MLLSLDDYFQAKNLTDHSNFSRDIGDQRIHKRDTTDHTQLKVVVSDATFS